MSDKILIQNGIPVGFWNPSFSSHAKFAMENYGGILGERSNFEVKRDIEQVERNNGKVGYCG